MKPAAPLLTAFLLASFAVTAHAAEASVAAKPDLAKGQAKSAEVCAACHTNDGTRGSPANPILQGQHPEYLAKQLTEFKSGTRDDPIMKGMAAPLSDADIKNVTAMMKFIVDGMGAWSEALNQQHFSVDEYYWVRDRVYSAAGLHLTELALRNAPDTVKSGGNLFGPMAGLTGPVPARNKQLVAPYLPNMKDWAKLAFFGL